MAYTYFYGYIVFIWFALLLSSRLRPLNFKHFIIGITTIAYSLAYDTLLGNCLGHLCSSWFLLGKEIFSVNLKINYYMVCQEDFFSKYLYSRLIQRYVNAYVAMDQGIGFHPVITIILCITVTYSNSSMASVQTPVYVSRYALFLGKNRT